MSNPPYTPFSKGGRVNSPPFLKGGRVNSPPFLKGDLEGFLYEVKNVVAQFIGQLCLMNQATTKSCHFALCLLSFALLECQIPLSPPFLKGEADR